MFSLSPRQDREVDKAAGGVSPNNEDPRPSTCVSARYPLKRLGGQAGDIDSTSVALPQPLLLGRVQFIPIFGGIVHRLTQAAATLRSHAASAKSPQMTFSVGTAGPPRCQPVHRHFAGREGRPCAGHPDVMAGGEASKRRDTEVGAHRVERTVFLREDVISI